MEKYYLRDEISEETDKELADFSPIIRELLFHRGIKNISEAEMFLNPDYEQHLHDPFLMRDMEKAVKRVLNAVKKGERVAVFSDFDADGVSSGVILYDLFKKLGHSNFRIYIPHRHEEGYGLNNEAMEDLIKDGVSLLVTADCGIGDEEVLQLATEAGVDTIVTDHHLPAEKEPPVFAVLNPKVDDYPDKELCGAGVAFKLVQGIIKYISKEPDIFPEINTEHLKNWQKWLLDMVGLATIADMVPLRGENRTLAYYGLIVLRKTKRPGLLELFKIMRTNPSAITEDDVGFMLAPRINAVSRMEAANVAFDLLAEKRPEKATDLAEYVNKLNNKRKGLIASMIKEIRSVIKEQQDSNVIMTGNPEWKPALLGLAANTLVKEYQRPVFLWGREGNGTLKGSCRSDGSVDLSELMGAVSDKFLHYGGHKWAGGFSVAFENIHHLKEELSHAYDQIASFAAEKKPVDKTLKIEDIDWKTYRMIRALAPFGEGNPKPLFLFKDVIIRELQKFGQQNEHLKIVLENDSGRTAQGISFFTREEDMEKVPEKGKKADIIASIESSDFGGKSHLRLRIENVVE